MLEPLEGERTAVQQVHIAASLHHGVSQDPWHISRGESTVGCFLFISSHNQTRYNTSREDSFHEYFTTFHYLAAQVRMTIHTYNPNPNAFVRVSRKIYNPIGFKKGYNFVLFFIFAGALLGFCLARLQYLSIDGLFRKGASPGEWFYYTRTFYKVGIAIHLCSIIPAGLLVIFQFIPAIRYKATIVHRINGYVVITLLTLANVGALMIARYAFGGTMATQALVGVLAISTLGSAYLAYYNIKRLQIDQHRAWMLRCWFYAGAIITLRLIMAISAVVISQYGNYYIAMSCGQINSMGGNATAYPACQADPEGHTAVVANFSTPTGVEQVAAALQTSFGMAGWYVHRWVKRFGETWADPLLGSHFGCTLSA